MATVESLVVAGGGGGGGRIGAGGGAGGLLYDAALAVTAQPYPITVGNGGNAGASDGTSSGTNGGGSTFSSMTAAGGGYGGLYNTASGANGGSGGGETGYGDYGHGTGTAGQGNDGGQYTATYGGAGGGGAGAVGGNSASGVGGTGGVGLQYSISGSAVYYAGGGGGSSYPAATTPGVGGLGGGATGGETAVSAATTPTANSGGGGGGGDTGSGVGAATPVATTSAGAAGVVIIAYATDGTFTAVILGGPATGLVEYLVVAGGGGVGANGGGGGGAGGFLTANKSVTHGAFYSITVGGGGAAGGGGIRGGTGGDSTFDAITCTGGGGGGSRDGGTVQGEGGDGGSGGGGGGYDATRSAGLGNTPATTPSQGNNGAVNSGSGVNQRGGGGGGASAAGTTGGGGIAGDGGAGTASSISGSSVTYAGGGAGQKTVNGTVGTDGVGADQAGGGGGTASAVGLDGVVIISYAADGSDGVGQSSTGGTVTSSGGNIIHTFTTDGTFIAYLYGVPLPPTPTTRYGTIGDQFFLASGEPLAGGTLLFVDSVTGEEVDTYFDKLLAAPNTNPVILDAAGRQPDIWIDDTVSFLVLEGDVSLLSECLPYLCNAFEQALYLANADGWIWDAYTLDFVNINESTSVEHNGKKVLRVGQTGNSNAIVNFGVLGVGNDCLTATCLRSDAGAGSSVIELQNAGDPTYTEITGTVRGGMLIDTTGQITNDIPKIIAIKLGLTRNGSPFNTQTTQVAWASNGLYLGGTFFPFTLLPDLVQPGPMWIDGQFDYYHGPSFQLRVIISVYINGLFFATYDHQVANLGGAQFDWSPAYEMIFGLGGGLTQDMYVSNLYHTTDTQASWVADGRMADMLLGYDRNFSDRVIPAYCSSGSGDGVCPI
jgi:hypothetical protein